MSPKKSERRQKIRFDVEGLRGGVRLPADASIVDLSFGGLGVETDRWLQVGRGYTVSLPTHEKTLRVSGTVAWCRLARTVKNEAGEAAPLYKAGIEFDQPDEATIEAIEILLSSSARVGFVERLKAMTGRFRSRREPKVDVALEHTFSVRRLSLTGMLVEADFLPTPEEHFRVALDLGDDLLEATARVAYVDRTSGSAGGEPAARIGLEFIDLEVEQRKLLGGIIQSEVASSSARFVGNPETRVYHRPDCRYASACTSTFRTRRQAEAGGFRAGACCLE